MQTNAQKKASQKYTSTKTKQYPIRFLLESDGDVIERIESVPNRTDYLRRLIRNDIAVSGDVADNGIHTSSIGEDSGDDSLGRNWLLVASPKVWSFSGLRAGERQSYAIYNDNGKPYRIHNNFVSVKPGDRMVGYESHPTSKIVALCEICEGPDPNRIYFRKIKNLDEPVSYSDLKEDESLTEMEFMQNPNCSLYRLTDTEYLRIMELAGEEDSPLETMDLEPYTPSDFLADVYVSQNDFEDMINLLQMKRNLILQGSPGTGKTFCATRLAWAMLGRKDDSHTTFVQFHQSTTYDDFVCGYRAAEDGGFEIRNGPFVRACHEASKNPSEPYFFIIDEINRANISKVFGELLMLIEADHRELDSVLLTVSDKHLTVPKNLFIIGMMNTADRGLALIDYALRRRFAFFEMQPALNHPHFIDDLQSSGKTEMLNLVHAVAKVNDVISSDPALGRGFRIGHSYFCGGKSPQLVLKYEILPLLEEYWFDDQKKFNAEKAKLEAALS